MSRLEALKELSDRNIKALKEGRVISSAVHPNDLVFLVQQAERFEILAEQHDRVLAENQRYKQALQDILNEDVGLAKLTAHQALEADTQ